MIKKRNKKGLRPAIFLTKNRKGLSPVVTSLLLVALVVVITFVIFLWFRGMVEEGVVKFGKNIRLVCDDVKFDASYSMSTLSVVNTGNVPIYNLRMKSTSEGGNYQSQDIKTIEDSWPNTGLLQGGTFTMTLSGSYEKITLYPILIGASGSGKKTYVCEGQYGKDVEM